MDGGELPALNVKPSREPFVLPGDYPHNMTSNAPTPDIQPVTSAAGGQGRCVCAKGTTSMLRFMTASFLLLGWTFYEASGGAEFAPPASAASPAPVIASSVDDPRLLEADRVLVADAGDYVAPNVPDAMPVEIVSRGTTDLAPVAALPAKPETVAPQDSKVLYEVTGNGVNMRAGPGTANGVVATLRLGTHAEVIGSEGNWSHIRLDDGTEGWMSANYLSEV